MIWDIAGIIILTLLKILGIILLVLLVLLLLVLFVPIRYHVGAAFYEEYEVQGSISWLCFLVRFPFWWKDGQVQWKLQILGIPILKSTKNGSHTRRHNSKRKGSHRTKRKKAVQQSASPEEKSEVNRQPERDAVLMEENAQDDKKPEMVEDTAVLSEEEVGKTEQESILDPRDSERAVDQRDNTEEPALDRYNQSEDAQNKKKHKRRSLFKRLWQKICELYLAVCDMIGNIRRKLHSVQDLRELLQKDSSRRFICIAKENMLQLWKHLKPQKIQGEIRFGTGDPCSTGQILGGIAVFYSWLGTGVHITPDFEEACFEGRIKGKGRIRVLTMVIILIRLVRNKDFRKLQQEWRQWKEDF